MLAFNTFDPYAMLARQTPEDAKPAKLAKAPPVDPTPALASLATLAAGEPQSHSALADNWQVFFDERRHIMEDYDLCRAEAERIAFEDCITRWREKYPTSNDDAAINALTQILFTSREQVRHDD